MASNAEQNRLAIQLAQECLRRSGFDDVSTNRERGTFPHTAITARQGARKYLIGVTSREEIGADGKPNPSYNIVKTAQDMAQARQMARMEGAIPAFVAIALSRADGQYAAFFGTLEKVEFRRSIPMLPSDRHGYEVLETGTKDTRVRSLG